MEHMLGSLATAQEMADASQPNMPAQQLRVLTQFAHNESLLAALGASKEVRLLSLAMRCCCSAAWHYEKILGSSLNQELAYSCKCWHAALPAMCSHVMVVKQSSIQKFVSIAVIIFRRHDLWSSSIHVWLPYSGTFINLSGACRHRLADERLGGAAASVRKQGVAVL